MKQQRKKQQAIKRTGRRSKPREKRGPRKPKVMPERLAPVLASEINLRCKQIKQTRPGKFERCGAPAVGFLPGAGDSCDDHKVKPSIRYATRRAERVSKAA